MKSCRRCIRDLPLDLFCKSAKSPDGKDIYCRDCKREINRAYTCRPENKAKIRANKKKYQDKPENKQRYRAWCRTDATKARRRRNDKKSPRHIFYATLRLAKIRRPSEHSATVEQLMEMFHAQRGKCAITGLTMTWGYADDGLHSPTAVSMDRIDNDRGYELDNIRLICRAINMFRGRMHDDEMYQMALAIVANAKRPKLRLVS